MAQGFQRSQMNMACTNASELKYVNTINKNVLLFFCIQIPTTKYCLAKLFGIEILLFIKAIC